MTDECCFAYFSMKQGLSFHWECRQRNKSAKISVLFFFFFFFFFFFSINYGLALHFDFHR